MIGSIAASRDHRKLTDQDHDNSADRGVSGKRRLSAAAVDHRHRVLSSLTCPHSRPRFATARLVLDEPTELPEGEVVELVPLDEVLANGGDYLDDEERAALHRELEASLAEVEQGKCVDADEVIAQLRAMR